MSAEKIIRELDLLPHPEGGYYRETYRSSYHTTTPQGKQRNVSTAIHYLLEGRDKSHFHRIESDELWFFHEGSPLEIVSIRDGELQTLFLGMNLAFGETPQAIIPANTWFAARVKNATGYALVSCTVAPGFDFADFTLASKNELMEEFPHLSEVIELFTR